MSSDNKDSNDGILAILAVAFASIFGILCLAGDFNYAKASNGSSSVEFQKRDDSKTLADNRRKLL